MRFLIGGRYACLSCLSRGVTRGCARCRRDEHVVDIENDVGRRQLALRRAAGALPRGRNPLFDPSMLRALPVGRAVVWVGTRIAFGLAFAATMGLPVEGTPSDALRLVGRAVTASAIGLTAVGLWISGVAVFVLAALGLAGVLAQALLALAWTIGLGAKIAPSPLSQWLGRAWVRTTVLAQRDVMQRALDQVDRWFVPRVRAVASVRVPDGPTIEGRVCSEDAIRVLVDRGAGIELREAQLRAFEIECADGARVVVKLASGVLDCDPGALEAVEPSELPAWSDGGRSSAERTRAGRVPRGARVSITGGWLATEMDAEATDAGYRTAPMRTVLRADEYSPAMVRVIA